MDEYYEAAAHILKEVHSRKDSVRSLVYSYPLPNTKLLYRLCCKVMEYWHVLTQISDEAYASDTFATENPELLYVLLFDHLFGQKLNCNNRRWRSAVDRRAGLIIAARHSLIQKGVIDDQGTLLIKGNDQSAGVDIVQIPRCVRINTLISSKEEVESILDECGWLKVNIPCVKRKKYSRFLSALNVDAYCDDKDFGDALLFFASGTDLHRDELFLSSSIILQDKSSYLATFALNPPKGSHVIDCCSAPGMKTSHLAALMQNCGKIFAIDLNHSRCKTMDELLYRYNVTCAEIMNRDFLKLHPQDPCFGDVEYILVDPPCTGSGIVNRQDLTESSKFCEKRMNSLGNIQAMLLKHALKFPKVKRVVYSTCSTNERENEHVINEVVNVLSDGFKLVKVLPEWKRRGLKTYDFGDMCIRTDPVRDLTNGFFVACFER